MPIYVDNNATTAPAPEVTSAMLPYLKELYFNPSSPYPPAQQVQKAITQARQEVAKFLGGVDPCQVFFTSCATESNNWAILGSAKANPHRKHIITTAVEHPAVLEVCKEMARSGYEVTYLPVDKNGQLNLSDYVRALRKDTLLVTIMHANNETGVIFPIHKLAALAKETDPHILFHTDATQTAGKIPLNLANEFGEVDLLSFSGHKIHAPKGIGALYIKKGTPCRPFIIGGHQENGLRAGTENVPYIVGLATACHLSVEHYVDEEPMRALRDYLQSTLQERIPYLEVNGGKAPRLANTLNVACHYIEGESILYQLSEYGICASSGSACTSGSLEPSHVLRAMNIPFTAVHGSIRFSLSRYNTKKEIQKIIDVFPKIVENLRKISPYWDTKTNAPRADAPKIS